MILDENDKKLLKLLQQNRKQTTKQLSLQLHLSVTAVYERIKKLEKEQVIEKYVSIINKQKIEKKLFGFLSYQTDATHQRICDHF